MSLDCYPTERDDFWRILGIHGCRMYFNCHEHFFCRYEKDGVFQIHCAGAGAWLYYQPTMPPTPYPGTIPAYHYVVVSIDGDNVTCRAKDSYGVQFDSWSYSIGLEITPALGKPDGTAVTLTNKLVAAVFNGFLYVQEDDRSHGIRVNPSPMPAVTPGDRVNVSGILGTIAGERALTGSATKVTP
jgi:hypothetical protein